MSSPAAKLGIQCKLYLNGNTYASPTWSAVNCVSDFTLSAKWDEGDASVRETRIKLALKTMLALGFAGKLRAANANDANYATIIAALVTDAQLDIMVLNGDSATNGVTGFRTACQLFGASEDQGLGAIVFEDVEFKPCPNINSNYSSVLIASSVPVFTAL